MIRRSDAASIPSATCRIHGRASSSGIGPPRVFMIRARSVPSTYSITRSRPPSGKVCRSWTATTCGELICAISFASFRNRSPEPPGAIILSATNRSSGTCQPL